MKKEQVGEFKGLLSPESEKKGGQMVDHAIKAKGIVEIADGPIATLLIRGLDNNFGDRVPEGFEVQANMIIDGAHDAFVNGNKEGYTVAIKALKEILIAVLPLEKLIEQSGEDAVMEMLEMFAIWLIMGKNGLPEK